VQEAGEKRGYTLREMQFLKAAIGRLLSYYWPTTISLQPPWTGQSIPTGQGREGLVEMIGGIEGQKGNPPLTC
jgi:hypothetical protein